jgi:hypothetical protein
MIILPSSRAAATSRHCASCALIRPPSTTIAITPAFGLGSVMSRRLPSPKLPDDLVPLPRYPGGNLYRDNPIDPLIARSAIWHAAGSITRAARLLDLSPARLLAFVNKDDYLKAERLQASELMVDQAEDVLLDLLDDDERKEDIAKWVLDRRGSTRGWGSSVKPTNPTIAFGGTGTAAIAIKWQSDDE